MLRTRQHCSSKYSGGLGCLQGNISGYTLSARAAIIDYCCLAGSIESPSRVHSYTVKSIVACYVTLVFTKTTSSCACGVVHLCAQFSRMTLPQLFTELWFQALVSEFVNARMHWEKRLSRPPQLGLSGPWYWRLWLVARLPHCDFNIPFSFYKLVF